MQTSCWCSFKRHHCSNGEKVYSFVFLLFIAWEWCWMWFFSTLTNPSFFLDKFTWYSTWLFSGFFFAVTIYFRTNCTWKCKFRLSYRKSLPMVRWYYPLSHTKISPIFCPECILSVIRKYLYYPFRWKLLIFETLKLIFFKIKKTLRRKQRDITKSRQLLLILKNPSVFDWRSIHSSEHEFCPKVVT